MASMRQVFSVFVRGCHPSLEIWPASGPFLLIPTVSLDGLLTLIFQATDGAKEPEQGMTGSHMQGRSR